MVRLLKTGLFVWCVVHAACMAAGVSYAAPNEKNALYTMKKATDFMMKTVSYRGGFVWKYKEDLTEQWGEVPARRTQIWVQGATNGVGEMLIDAYRVTWDPDYLEYAKKSPRH